MNGLIEHSDHPVDELPEYVRAGAAGAAEIERHLAGCEACRAEVAILTALADPGAPVLGDVERERAYRSFEERRVSESAGRTPVGSRWLRITWKLAAGFAVLLTSVGVLRVVQVGQTADWDPDVAVEGFAQDLADIDLSAGELRLALGAALVDEQELDPGWESLDEADVDNIAVPWENDR